jgi:hypothetical protein
MATGEEHARQALTAASMVATVRTRVIQADHEVTTVRELLGAAISGSTNELALDARDAIWQAERVLSETQALLLRSAEEADTYVDQIAPGLRSGPSVSATPVPGEDLLTPRPRARSLRDSLDQGLKGSGSIEDLAKATDNAVFSYKGLDPPPTKTATSTSQPGPHAQSATPTVSSVDAISAGVTSLLLFARGAQLAYDHVKRKWRPVWRRRNR